MLACFQGKCSNRSYYWLLFALAVGLAVMSRPLYASPNTPVHVTGFSSIPLVNQLTPVAPPSALKDSTTSMTSNTVQWYRFSLKNADALSKRWVLVFRQVPYSLLNVYTVNASGYTLTELGVSSASEQAGKTTSLIALPETNNTSTYLLAVEAPYPNQFSPVLWPEGIYVLNQSKSMLLASLLLSIVAFTLIAALVKSALTQSTQLLLPASHMLSLLLLLAFSHTSLFTYLPVAGDPGHWILVTAMITFLTAFACYRQLTDMPRHTPIISASLLVGCFVSISLLDSLLFLPNQAESLVTYGFIAMVVTGGLTFLGLFITSVSHVPVARPTLMVGVFTLGLLAIAVLLEPLPRTTLTPLESSILVLHSILLSLTYWYANYQEQKNTATVTLEVPGNKQRLVFENALREHLQKPDITLTHTEIPERIIATSEAALPNTPVCVAHYQKNEYRFVASSHSLTAHFQQQLPVIKPVLQQVIATNTDSHVHVMAHSGQPCWVFSLWQDTDSHTLLLYQSSRTTPWRTASDIASHAKTLYQAYEQLQYWKDQASLDPLTGLLNRRAFTQEAEVYLHRLAHEHDDCGLLFIDIDNFKHINDEHGHAKGDELLQSIAVVCTRNLRQEDMVCRLGGEEFVVLLPSTSPSASLQVAERLRKAIEQSPLTIGITASIGLAVYDKKTTTLEQLLQAADKALYSAKQSGRNKVNVADAPINLTSPS